MESDSVLAVGCLNNDRSVLAKSYAWRPLALLLILKGSACVETNDDWVRHRRMELYHSSMDYIIADINELCSKDMYLRFADGQARCSRAFYHLLVMDGQEVGAALMCDVNQCPVCTCPTATWTGVTGQMWHILIATWNQSRQLWKKLKRCISMRMAKFLMGTTRRYAKLF